MRLNHRTAWQGNANRVHAHGMSASAVAEETRPRVQRYPAVKEKAGSINRPYGAAWTLPEGEEDA